MDVVHGLDGETAAWRPRPAVEKEVVIQLLDQLSRQVLQRHATQSWSDMTPDGHFVGFARGGRNRSTGPNGHQPLGQIPPRCDVRGRLPRFALSCYDLEHRLLGRASGREAALLLLLAGE